MQRTESEISALMEEAERRVRAGESHTDVALALGIPLSTLNYHAGKGGWRRKDLACERDEARGRAMLAQIAARAFEDELAAQERTLRLKTLAEAAAAAMTRADPDREGKPSGLTTVSTPRLSLGMTRLLLEQGQLDEAARAARVALQIARAEEAAGARQEEQWRQDRASIMSWWDENRDGFFEFYEQAKAMAAELEGLRKYQRDLRDYECCPTCSRSMKFWPPEMQEEDDRVSGEFERRNL
jgi:hypothetical protein